MDIKKCLGKEKKVSKNAEVNADFKSVEKVFKKCTKSYKQNMLTNMSKSGKCAYFRHAFANNFFKVHLKKTFLTDLKST
jgi:hypothetical protein